ncbi:MAG: hypothetical protein EBY49_11270 [Actinobacteria bacterium]|nr:hypothetical protein [Actinomycetota bacterium]
MHIQLRRGLIASDQVAATIFAVEMAELVEQTTGNAVSVWGSVYGMPLGGNQVTLCTSNYGTATGTMIFFMGFDSAEGVDATQETLMSDSTYMEAMGQTAELFLPDGQRTLAQRLN